MSVASSAIKQSGKTGSSNSLNTIPNTSFYFLTWRGIGPWDLGEKHLTIK